MQYDEHLSKTMGQWHAKKAFSRGVLNIGGCVSIIDVILINTLVVTILVIFVT